jgi:hypothetical protein
MHRRAIKLLAGIALAALFFSNNFALFVLAYVFTALAMILYTGTTKNSKKAKAVLSAIYLMIMSFQLAYNALAAFSENNSPLDSMLGRAAGILFVLLPFIINRLFTKNRNAKFYLPSAQEITTLTFNEIVENINKVKEIIAQGQENLSKDTIEELLKDMPRHDSFRYINKGSLAEEYFDRAYQTMEDQNIYIVISNTGSPASKIISMFTKKQYNHASLSFDRALTTIVSYNGGERIYPPGLNMEMIQYFNKKQDSSIIVYSTPAGAERKKKIIDKIREINRQGNAYNLLGLVFKFSFKPNILYCSQFVYKMLKEAGIHYFEKNEGRIKPTDLVELDYYRKLRYEYEIKFTNAP